MAAQSEVILEISGMTCASCVARVEKGLENVPGVTASVNLVTNSARVEFPSSVTTAQLVQAVASLGYTASIAAEESSGFSERASSSVVTLTTVRLWVSVALTVPVVALAMVPAWQFAGWQWLSLILATPVVFWCAWPIHRATIRGLRHASLTMDTLISLGTLVAWGWSVYALFFGMAGMWGMTHPMAFFAWQQDPTANIYFETAAGVTTFILLGRWLEERSKRSAASALEEIGKLQATLATVMRDGVEMTVPIEKLRVDDVVVVKPGDTIPVDGDVRAGSSALDLSALTGESLPVEINVGAHVSAGTIALDGRLEIVARRVHADTRLAQLGALVERAQLRKMSVQRLADKISAVFVPAVIGVSIITVIAWLAMGQSLASGLTAAVAVIVIACPCALGLATPVALIVGTGRAASMGIIISGPEVLEQSASIDMIVLDKTGTITTGAMSVVRVATREGTDEQTLLLVAAAVERGSEHPIAHAITTRAAELSLDSPKVTSFRAVAGGGAVARVANVPEAGDVDVWVGQPEWLIQNGATFDENLTRVTSSLASSLVSSAGVAWGGAVRGVISMSDSVRDDSVQAISRLRRMGLEPVIVTGDGRETAMSIAGDVGIDRVHARVSPEEKVTFVADAQRDGHVVAMVGDGINDAAALAQADIGLAMGTGTDLAIAASDITLVRGTLSAAADAIVLSRKTLAIIRGNLFWAFAYNIIMIPLAAVGLLTPMLAGAAMAFSSLFVVLNSLRLRSVTLTA
jgi:Cu+-exporting ATPase